MTSDQMAAIGTILLLPITFTMLIGLFLRIQELLKSDIGELTIIGALVLSTIAGTALVLMASR